MWEFGVPEGEVPHEPLPIRPDMVILGVFREHAGEKRDFSRRHRRDMSHYHLAMVPADRSSETARE